MRKTSSPSRDNLPPQYYYTKNTAIGKEFNYVQADLLMVTNKNEDMATKMTYDTVIIGGGLAGIAAGIALQQAGLKTLIIEKRDTLGGLCGTFRINGYEFVLGCNDFGSSIKRYFKQLGVEQTFKPSKNIFHFDNMTLTLPSLRALIKLLKYTPDLLRIRKIAQQIKSGEKDYIYLDELIAEGVQQEGLKDILGMLCYALGLPASKLRLKDLGNSLFNKELNYGYDKSIIPVGGPAKMVDAMELRYRSLGGELRLGQEVIHSERRTEYIHIIRTQKGATFHARTLISSQPRLAAYPPQMEEATYFGMLHFFIDKQLAFPKNIHAISRIPPYHSNWLERIYEGVLPKNFGFHFFKSDLPNNVDGYAVNAYYLVPKGQNSLSAAARNGIRDTIVEKMNRYVPGLEAAILFEKHIDPSEYQSLHGLNSRVLNKLLMDDFKKPSIYNPETNIYHIGNSVQPSGEHACGAMLSGLRAAEMIERHFQNAYDVMQSHTRPNRQLVL